MNNFPKFTTILIIIISLYLVFFLKNLDQLPVFHRQLVSEEFFEGVDRFPGLPRTDLVGFIKVSSEHDVGHSSDSDSYSSVLWIDFRH